jgi:ferritin-like metal-binding protein YciE
MAKEPKQLEELFHYTLFCRDEDTDRLTQVAKAGRNPDLKAAFEKHRGETESQVEHEQVFALINKKPQGKNCPAILAIIEEGTEVMEDYTGSPTTQGAQRIQ